MKWSQIEDHEMEIELQDSDENTSHRRYKSSCRNDEEIDDPPFAWRSKVFKGELKTNLRMAFPVLITNIMQYLLNVETMSFCGRLKSIDLESVGLAISILTALGWCACSGMVSACDTMFAQAFGSEEKKRTGLFLQRGLLILNLVPLFLLAFHVNMEPILILLGQDREISRGAGAFLISFSPGLIFMMNYLILARYMQDQGCLWPPVVAGLCGNLFNILTQLLFVTYLGYGFRVAALCHALSYGVMLSCELIYIFKTKFYIPTWPGFQLEAFYDWSHFFKLGMFGVAHITFEVLIWEGNVFMGGIIGSIELATQSIFLQLLNVLFVTYYGAGIASNIRVGQCLGANKPNQAKAAYRAGIVTIGLGVMVLASSVIALRYHIPYVFTNKIEVINMVSDTFPSIYIILFVDPFSAVFNATLRGCGRQAIGSLIIFVGFYIVAVPLGIVLAFVFKYGILGLWIGTSVGEVISVSITSILLECQSWEKQAELAQQRIICGTVKAQSGDSNVESKSLLPALFIDDDLKYKVDRHIRTPSYPVTCSTEIVELPKPRAIVHKSIIYKKLILALCVFLFFLCGVIVHNFLPVKFYRIYNSSIVSE